MAVDNKAGVRLVLREISAISLVDNKASVIVDQRRVHICGSWFQISKVHMAAHRGGVGLSSAIGFLFDALCACCLLVVPRRGICISRTANTRVLIILLFSVLWF